MRKRLIALALAALTSSLVAAAPASADIYDDFRQNGTVDTCSYSEEELQQGLDGLPPDIRQYAPGLADQLAGGRGDCGGGGGAPGSSSPSDTRDFETVPALGGAPPSQPPPTRVARPPSPDAAARSRLATIAAPGLPSAASLETGVPGWIWPLVAGLTLLGLIAGAIRFGGWSPERLTRPLGASFSATGERTADAVSQLAESLRFGR